MNDIVDNALAETEVKRKLEFVEQRYSPDFKSNIRSRKQPQDIRAILIVEREKALERNAQLLQDFDIMAAKLHTKRLCPMEKKLKQMKIKLGATSYPSTPTTSGEAPDDPITPHSARKS